MLRLDYEAIGEASKTLSEQGNIFEDCIKTMTTTKQKPVIGMWNSMEMQNQL